MQCIIPWAVSPVLPHYFLRFPHAITVEGDSFSYGGIPYCFSIFNYLPFLILLICLSKYLYNFFSVLVFFFLFSFL